MKPYNIYKIAIQEEKFRRAIEALDEIISNGREYISGQENAAIRTARESIRNARNRNAEKFEEIEAQSEK